MCLCYLFFSLHKVKPTFSVVIILQSTLDCIDKGNFFKGGFSRTVDRSDFFFGGGGVKYA